MQTNGLKKSFQRKKECTWRTLLDQIDTKNFRYAKVFSKKFIQKLVQKNP